VAPSPSRARLHQLRQHAFALPRLPAPSRSGSRVARRRKRKRRHQRHRPTISGSGTSGCTVSGTVTPRAHGNVFNVSLTFGRSAVHSRHQTSTGAAYFDAADPSGCSWRTERCAHRCCVVRRNEAVAQRGESALICPRPFRRRGTHGGAISGPKCCRRRKRRSAR